MIEAAEPATFNNTNLSGLELIEMGADRIHVDDKKIINFGSKIGKTFIDHKDINKKNELESPS